MMDAFKNKLPPHSSHPDFANLTLLVFEAVMEVVCVSLPGYIIARMGMFDADSITVSGRLTNNCCSLHEIGLPTHS